MKKRTTITIPLNIFLILLVPVIISPAAWPIMNSLRTNVELFTGSLALSAKVQFANHISVWNKGLHKCSRNSVVVSSISLISTLFLSPLLAYGIARLNNRFGSLIFLVTLGGMALSEQMALVPLYKVLQATHLYDTCWAVILPYMTFRIPSTVFLMHAYFACIPEELEEVVVIDGYNSLQIFRKVIVPISEPIFASYVTMNPNFVWNGFLLANVFLESKSIMIIPIGLMIPEGDMGSDYVIMLVSITIASLPMIVLYPCMQKQFARDLTSGTVKRQMIRTPYISRRNRMVPPVYCHRKLHVQYRPLNIKGNKKHEI